MLVYRPRDLNEKKMILFDDNVIRDKCVMIYIIWNCFVAFFQGQV